MFVIFIRCPPEFVYLYREFGGDLFLKDDHGRLATEITEAAPALQIMKQLQGRSCITQHSQSLPIVYSQVINYNPSERGKDARTNCANTLNFADYPFLHTIEFYSYLLGYE